MFNTIFDSNESKFFDHSTIDTTNSKLFFSFDNTNNNQLTSLNNMFEQKRLGYNKNLINATFD